MSLVGRERGGGGRKCRVVRLLLQEGVGSSQWFQKAGRNEMVCFE